MAAPDALEEKSHIFRYKLETLKISFPEDGETVDIEPGLVSGFIIEKDFDNDFFPIFRLDMSIDTKLYYRILDNKTTVKFIIKLRSYAYKDLDDTKPAKKDVFNTIFIPFIDDETPFLERKEYENAAKVSSDPETLGKKPETTGGNEFSIYLFKEDDILKSKKIVNTVLTSTNMTDAIAYVLTKAGINKVLMTPLGNSNTYSEVVIPPLSAMSLLKYLDAQYGFHVRGTIMFFDFDALYLIEKSYVATAWVKNEYKDVIFIIREPDDPIKYAPGIYTDDKKKTHFVNIFHENLKLANPAISKDQIEGINKTIVSSKPRNAATIRASSKARGSGTYQVFVNRYVNPYATSAEKYRIESEGKIAVITSSDVDISVFRANKQYTFKYSDTSINSKIGGKLRLSKSVFAFTNSGDYFSNKVELTFKR